MSPHITLVKPTLSPVILPRSGSSPLSFFGHLLAKAGEPPTDKYIVRWHELELYLTNSGRYVVAIHFRTTSRHEKPWNDAFPMDTVEEVVSLLEEYDPVEYVLGWPVPRYADKDKRVRETLIAEFDVLVSALLAGLEEFAEKV
jgi:hypothetical protein